MVSRSRMPPPSCTGILSPTSRRMALIAGSLTGLPAKAPLRSTRCRRRAPASSQRRAIAAGSSPKVVETFMSPFSRRTQWPSFRSMAGISSMAGAAARWGVGGIERGSGLPGEEVAIQGQALVGTLLGMELGGKNVIPRHCAGKALTVLGEARDVARVRRRGVITVHEVEPAAVGHALPDRMWRAARRLREDLVPAHLRHLVAAAVGLDAAFELEALHAARDQAEAGCVLLLTVVEQHLHAHAHAHQRLAHRGVEHSLLQPRVVQLAHAVAHRALAGQHHPLGGHHVLGSLGDDHLVARGGGHMHHRLRHRAQVAHAVVDDGHCLSHGYRLPLVEGITPAERASGVSAKRSARPKALNTVSAWWWALMPFRLSMCSVHNAWLTKPWKNS